MSDALDDATQTLLEIEEALAFQIDVGGAPAFVHGLMETIQAWKRRPDQEEVAA